MERTGPPPEPRRASDGTVIALAHRIEQNRRLNVATDEVAVQLDRLDAARWLVARDVIAEGWRFRFLVAGPTGLFALEVTDGGWTLDDLSLLHGGAERIRDTAFGYPDPVRLGVVVARSERLPTQWWNAAGAGGWALGAAQLERWLHHFDDQGFSASDIAELRGRSQIDWSRSETKYVNINDPARG